MALMNILSATLIMLIIASGFAMFLGMRAATAQPAFDVYAPTPITAEMPAE